MYKILHFHEEVAVKTDIPSFLSEKKDIKSKFFQALFRQRFVVRGFSQLKYVKEVTYYVYLNPVFVNFAVAGPFDCLTLSVCLYDSQSLSVCLSV